MAEVLKTERHRTTVSLVSCAVIGLAAGGATLGFVLSSAGSSADGVAASRWRWTVLPFLIAVAGTLLWSTGLTARTLVRRKVGNAIGWLAAVAMLIAAGLALRQGDPPKDSDQFPDAVTNAATFATWAPLILLLAAILFGVAAGLGYRVMIGDFPPLEFSRWVFIAGLLAGCLLVGCGLAAPRIADARAERANTTQTPAATVPDLEPAVRSQLTGKVAWTHDYDSSHHPGYLDTSGGLATRVEDPDGIEMHDPATGEVRWSWRRADLNSRGEPMVGSVDGKLIATRFASSDQYPEPPGVVVLSADTGALRARFSGSIGSPIAVQDDQVVTLPSKDSDLAAYGFDGEQRWTRDLPGDVQIRNDHESQYSTDGRTLLVTAETDSQDGRWRTAAIDLATGQIRWQQDLPPQMAPLTIVEGTDLAVTGGLDRQPGSELQQPAAGRIIAYRISDGETEWQRRIALPAGVTGHSENDGCLAQVDVDPDHLTLISCADDRHIARLAAVRPDTGEPLWARTITFRSYRDVPDPSSEDPLQAMPDGSTALLTSSQDKSGAEGCAILRVGADGVRRTPLSGEIDDACRYVEWRRAGDSVLIDQLIEGKLVALR